MKSVSPVSATGDAKAAYKTQQKPARQARHSASPGKDAAFISEKARDLEAQRTGNILNEEMQESPATEKKEEPLKGTSTTAVE